MLIRLSAEALDHFLCDLVLILIVVTMCCSLWLLILLIPNCLTSVVVNEPKLSVQQEKVSYRLPNETYPEHYTIHLNTNIHEANFSFTGRVEITVATREETSAIVVHARQLVISEVRLWNTFSTPTEIEINPFEYDAVTEFVTIRLTSGTLQSSEKFLLIIEYNGELREDNLGFYRSSYRDANDQLV